MGTDSKSFRKSNWPGRCWKGDRVPCFNFQPFLWRICWMLVSLRKNQVNYLGKSPSQTNNLRRQYRKISWYLFNKKSPMDSDKSQLCVCMIPNWYFESPVALVWPGLPLAPDAPDPLYFSFNHSVMSISQDNKIRNHSCFVRSPWCGTELITYPSKGKKCYREITLEFLTPDKTYLRNGRRMGTRSTPRSLLCPKWRASWYMISMQGLVWLSYFVFATKAFCFTIQLS